MAEDTVDAELDGRRLRLVALLEAGDVAGVDDEIDAFAADVRHLGPLHWWYVPLWQATRALLQGRFQECEARNTEAAAAGSEAHNPDAEPLCSLQFLLLRMAQDRLPELVAPTRTLVAQRARAPDVRATHALLLGMLGRDGEARSELRRLITDDFAAAGHGGGWMAATAVLAELAAMLHARAEAELLYKRLRPHARRFAVEPSAAGCHGSVSRHLGVLAYVLGRWDEADDHFAAALHDNRAAGAPLLVAHTRRDWSALLRARGDDGDWERALDLLAGAEAIYRHLGVDRPADDARVVLSRSHEPVPVGADPGPGSNAFRRDEDGWTVTFAGREVRLPDTTGVRDLATLLAHPGRSYHVADLLAGLESAGVGQAGQSWREPVGGGAGRSLPARADAEYRARLAELDGELADASSADDPVRASLARAERDFVVAQLAGDRGREGLAGVVGDPAERARKAVGTRIRLSIERIDAVHPALGRHLRHSVRTGMFCSYEPEVPTDWKR
jgi:tetratricopeptide (TPR) repeat protein